MTWQEYQTAVGKLYKNMEGMGVVKQNTCILDKITGQKRQIDVWCEINVDGHKINILIDAKYRKEKLDIKDLEEVEGLANAVKANKIIIVTNSGWTEPAQKRAEFSNIDFRILTIEDALGLIFPNKWLMCYSCKDECVLMDSDGVLLRENTNLFFYWHAGKCRNCKNLYFYCPECGDRKIIDDDYSYECNCKHIWKRSKGELQIKFNNLDFFQRIDNSIKTSNEFMYWLLGYDIENWRGITFTTLKIKTDNGNQKYFMIHPQSGELMFPDYEDEDGPSFFIPIE